MTTASDTPPSGSVVALAGGVGGAKLADGLSRELGKRLTVVVNTGDDFEHLGFYIAPDLDTVMYTLAGVANPELGWGLAGETWNFMQQVSRLGGPDWFKLGDQDLAVHALRTERLRRGNSLSAVTADLSAQLGVGTNIVPMSDRPVRTIIHSDDGALPFQEYFVRLRSAPKVQRIAFDGAQHAVPADDVIAALRAPSLRAIILCPSNPYLSIDPILSVPQIPELLTAAGVPIIAVSPIIAGAAIKGPAAKIMAELGATVSAFGVAQHYHGLIHGLVIDESDAALEASINDLGMRALVAPTIMKTSVDRQGLARCVLAFAEQLRKDLT